VTDGLADLVIELRGQINTLTGRVRDHDIALAEHERVSAGLDQVREQLADLQLAVGLDDTKKKGYKPHQNPRWWSLGPEEKAAEVGRIRGWLIDIAGPFLGTKGFPDCVLEHDEVLLYLDAACETWKTLWLPENRTAATAGGQSEYLTRIYPAIRAEVIRLTSGCPHQSGVAELLTLRATRVANGSG
jgi:hypothetical protein